MVSEQRFRRHVESSLDLRAILTGRRILSVSRRAKRIVLHLDNDAHLYIHLGMTGAVTLNPAREERHTHLVLTLGEHEGSGVCILAFSDPRRFGKLVYVPPGVAPDHDLGPEPLTLPARRLGRLLAHTRRPIKSALLDQTLIAGLGNIYVDEALFLARIHPLRLACSLGVVEVATLSRAIKTTLRRAIRHRGSTLRDYRDANGESGSFQKLHRVYDREGEKCRRCRTAIERIVLTGRSTHFCPACQKR